MLSLCLQPPPATHWTNGHWVYWPMKESARTSQRKENVISLSECFQVLFVNLINWVNILARFYEKLSWGISIENISFCWRPARWGGRGDILSWKIFRFACQMRCDRLLQKQS